MIFVMFQKYFNPLNVEGQMLNAEEFAGRASFLS